MSLLSHLECSACGRIWSPTVPRNLCDCGRPLLARYDLDTGRRRFADGLNAQGRGLWRWAQLLPVGEPGHRLELGEGGTPSLPLPRLAGRLGLGAVYLKDEAGNPTGTFKARGAAVAVSKARELGITRVAIPSAGNAGAAWAAYCARAGIRLLVVLPCDTPAAAQEECRLYGAEVEVVEGSLADAGRVAAERARAEGWFEAATLKEPYRVEGKKTVGLELWEEFGAGIDAIVHPCGGGVGLIGIHKAYQELAALGMVAGGEVPRLVAVQAAGCAPVVRAMREGAERADLWPEPRTLAAGLRVPRVLGDTLVLKALRQTGGTAVAVEDREMLEATVEVARHEGIWVCPEGAAAVAALTRLRETGFLGPGDRVVVVNTGTGLKHPELAAAARASGPWQKDTRGLSPAV